MQGNINSASGGLAVATKQAKEGIKRAGRIRIQERVPQSRLADFAYRQILPLVPGITKSQLPVPSLEIIGKFSHLTPKPDVKKTILVGVLFTSLTGVVDTAKSNACRYWSWNSVNIQRRIRDGERIKRIRDWHTDTRGAKADVSAWDLESIGCKRHSCEG